MKFSELTDAFYRYSNTTGSDVQAEALADWFNEAQLDLYGEFGPTSTREYSDAQSGWPGSDLPTDCMKAISLRDSAGNYIDYTVEDTGKIVFGQGGDLTLVYRPRPSVLFTGADSEAESDLPKETHIAMVLFAVSRYWEMDAEGDSYEMNEALRWMQYYQERKSALIKSLTSPGAGGTMLWQVI